MTALFYDGIIASGEMVYEQRSAETEKEMKRRKREVGQAKKGFADKLRKLKQGK